ncbi:MAG: nucleoside deaminase [Acidobacteriota bacterium]|jgi:tRNA(Arg) A34 adenosine deaminase TadA
MGWAIELSRRNVAEGTGGPFGAAVFVGGRLISSGVNLVVPQRWSIAHAEVVALLLAESAAGNHDLGADPAERYELFASSEPCIQCFGAIWWSGISRLVTGACRETVERLTGFQEGPVPADWQERLESREAPLRPVEVRRGVLAGEAAEVLSGYRGPVYNPS